MTSGSGTAPRLRVVQSFREPRPTTNPYLVQLRDSLVAAGADVRAFSWRTALLGRYDVLHVHWPEVMVQRRSRVRHAGAVLALWLTLARCALLRTAVVRTAHNLAPHEDPDRWTAAVLRACDARTTWWIRLNDQTPVPDEARATTVLHGDYAAWFAGHERARTVRGRLGYVGLIRPYKGVEELVTAFRSLPDPGAGLVVAGRPSTPGLGERLVALTEEDPRIRLDLRHVDDADLVTWVTSSELVVLPYRQMHNSGAALLALSLGRPVLVPANPVNEDLAREVGRAWVHQFAGALDADVLRDALDAVRSAGAGAGAGAGAESDSAPDLRLRAWPEVARQTLDVYRAAVDHARGRTAATDRPLVPGREPR